MREILFKAKRIDTGEWVYGNYAFTDVCGGHHFIFQNKAFEHEVDENTICQYTGLKDKHGNKIWENDIVMLDDEYWVVKWSDNDAQFTIEDDCTIENFGNVWGMDCEVCGNLFDNPELLEGGVE